MGKMSPVELQTTKLWSEPERRRLVGLCAAITGDRNAAEDLAQETLLEAWRHAHKLHDPTGADRWLAAIARNVCRRWARRRGRDLAFAASFAAEVPHDVEVELERTELAELLDRSLALLPPTTREVMIQRFVHDSTHAEIAALVGLSEDAVSMRISRGKLVLRCVLAAELRGAAPDDGWRETTIWCTECGKRKLVMRRDRAPEAIVCRCPDCQPAGVPGGVFRLDNPIFTRLVGELVRPTAMLRRILDWSGRYFVAEPGDVACTRCGQRVPLRPYVRDATYTGLHRRGLLAHCEACGEEATSSLAALALAQPEVRSFRREHARIRALPVREIDCGGVNALVIRHQNLLGSAGVDVVFARDTLRVLAAPA
jgi:RNA polymerase sigma factor (sigma-70 family)